jgi:hypothetical protein
MSVVDAHILREAAVKKSYKEGMEKGHIEDARRMKADNMAIELIVKYTGLTIEEVEALT